MRLRAVLVVLIVVATAGFIVGTSLERRNAHHEPAAQLKSEVTAPTAEGGGESAEVHAAEGAGSAPPVETHAELRPLGVNIEAVPFVILASLVSLTLAALAWVRPRRVGLLALLALAMILFGALDVREVLHQHDESNVGLALLAAVIAALHLAAAALAGAIRRAARA